MGSGERRGAARLSGVLGELAATRGWGKRFARSSIWNVWEDVVGVLITTHAWPVRFQETDTLVVVVSDSVWMQQLSYQRCMVLDALNRRLPPEAGLKDVRFVLGDVSEARAEWCSHKEQDRPGRLGREPEGGHAKILARADELTESLDDPELRRALRDLYLKSRQRCGSSTGDPAG